MIPWPKYTRKSFFGRGLAFRRFWVQEPRHSENRLAEMCYLYRRTRHMAIFCFSLPCCAVFYQSCLTEEKSSQQTSPSPRTSICLKTCPILLDVSPISSSPCAPLAPPPPQLLPLPLVAGLSNCLCPMCFCTTAKN